MADIWVTSDLHFFHDRDFVYKPRGFDNVEDMTYQIFENYCKVVKDEDTIYILGDLLLGGEREAEGIRLLNKMPGHKYIAIGNHDSNNRILVYDNIKGVIDVDYAFMFKHGKWDIYLSHFPTHVNNFESKRKTISCHGHTHSKDKFEWAEYGAYNVALEAHNNYPVNIETIINDVKEYKEKNKK
jgi:calcineurin-like phosphoesterase family protein